jgi:hypothetical protein
MEGFRWFVGGRAGYTECVDAAQGIRKIRVVITDFSTPVLHASKQGFQQLNKKP